MSNFNKNKGGGIKAFLIIMLAGIFILSAGIVITKGVTDKWPWEHLKKVETGAEEPEEPTDPGDRIQYDGKSHLFITLTKTMGSSPADALAVSFAFTKDDTSELSIDWGDGKDVDTVITAGAGRITHTYDEYGDYEIVLWISDGAGTYSFGDGTSYVNFFGYGNKGDFLTTCVIGDNVTRILPSSFYYCVSLKNVAIPEGVVSIGDYAFYSCRSLASVIIPSTAVDVGESAFSDCYSLTSVTILSDITTIKREMFASCFSLVRMVIPDSVIEIEDNAFYNCVFLKDIVVPNGVASIGDHAFSVCYYLGSVTIPSSVTSIGPSAFELCFFVEKFVFEGLVPPDLGYNAFYEINLLTKIYVPDAAVEVYKASSSWQGYVNCIYPMSEMPA